MSAEDKRMQITAERLLGIAELSYVGVQVVDGVSADALIRALLRVVEAYDKTTATSIQRDRLVDIHAFIQQALTDDETQRRIVEVCALTRTHSLDQIEGTLAFDARLKELEIVQDSAPSVPARAHDSIDELRDLALAATPGPWTWAQEEPWLCAPDPKWPDDGGRIVVHADKYEYHPTSADSVYIAAVDPTTVLALLDEIERLRAVVADSAGLA